MRLQIPSFFSSFSTLGLCIVMLLSACTSTNEIKSSASQKGIEKKANVNKPKKSAKQLEHSHPSNPCTEALTHSHVSDSEDHKHSYDCENTNEFISNAHVHPATKNYRRFRHVHPNGASKHTHHKQ